MITAYHALSIFRTACIPDLNSHSFHASHAAPSVVEPPSPIIHTIPSLLRPETFAAQKTPLQANAANICGAEMATLCIVIIAAL